MAVGLLAGYRTEQLAAANLNQAANTVLLSFYTPALGMLVRRIWLVAEAAAGILAPCVLKLSYSIDGGATFVDVTGATVTPGARARGILVYRNFTARYAIPTGALVAIRVSTDSGGAGTARLGLDYEPQPFQPVNLPTTAIAVVV